jgi:hypothetical protein
MAQAVARSRLFGFSESGLVTLMLLCQSLGIHPIRAVQRYSIIQRKPAMKSDAMLSDFQQIGGTCKWLTGSTDCEKAEAVFTHPVHVPDGQTVKFTIEDAKRAKLLTPDSGWEKYPASMLRARVVPSGIRMVAPGIVAGLYTPEEVTDFALSRPRLALPPRNPHRKSRRLRSAIGHPRQRRRPPQMSVLPGTARNSRCGCSTTWSDTVSPTS